MSEEEEAPPKEGCPLRNWMPCWGKGCAWWVPKHGHCAVCFIAEVAVQVKALRQLLEALIEVRDLLSLPSEK